MPVAFLSLNWLSIHLLNMMQVFTLLNSGISSLSLIIKEELGLKCAADCGEGSVEEISVQSGRKSENLRIGEDHSPLGHFILPSV